MDYSEEKMMQHMAGLRGDYFTTAGAGEKVFEVEAYGLTARAALTINKLFDKNGEEIVCGCTGITLEKGEEVFFGVTNVKSIFTTTSGLVKYYAW